MSDLRFIQQLGAEFERISAHPAARGNSRRRLGTGAARITIAGIGFGLSVLVVVGVVAVALLGTHARGPSGLAGSGKASPLVFRALSLDQRPARGPSIDRSVDIVRSRLVAAFGAAQIFREGNRVVVMVNRSAMRSRARIERLVGTVGRLEFYDWEASALTPDGKPVARQLHSQDRNALMISQGLGAGAGFAGSGSMSLYQAVMLAAKQPKQASNDNSRLGPQYYVFGSRGGAACAASAQASNTTSPRGSPCLLSGPADNLQDLYAGLPSGVHASDAGVQTLTVPQGTVVVKAGEPGQADPTPLNSPTAQFFVLRDHVSLFGNDITHPQHSTDQSGQPGVTFGFTAAGAKAFQTVTAAIAHRGNVVSGAGQTLDQHFAIALDNRLLTVPSIDFRTYPDGISGRSGADISGSFSPAAARDLAIVLRFGPLPVTLAPS